MKCKIALIPVISAAFILGFSFTGTAHAVSCGDTVLLDGKKVVLDTDLDCGSGDPSLTIVGPGTFDMDGHTLNCTNDANYVLKIEGERAKVLNGVVMNSNNCGDCIFATGDGSHTIEGMVAQDCLGDGITLASNRNTVKDSSSVGNDYGFYVPTTERNTIRDSQAVENTTYGFQIDGTGHTVRDSIAISNGRGFTVSGSDHKVQGNTATNNTSEGLQIQSIDSRIQKNRSLNNKTIDMSDNLADCDNNKWSNNVFGSAIPADCIQ